MNRYKLMNTLVRELKENNSIKITRFNINELIKIVQKYEHIEMITKEYCCYGENTCCWQDIEGEGYGWIWTAVPQHKWAKTLKREAILNFRRLKKELKGKNIILVYPNDYTIIIVLPLRDVLKRDFYITLSHKEID